MTEQSVRSKLVMRRSYSRPLNDAATEFETWPQTVNRVVRHQAWLWERAKGIGLDNEEIEELNELRQLLLDREGFTSGRSLWLGGTEISRTRESCSFNCAYVTVRTVFDVVDTLWLLLQGVGVGFTPQPGILNGFMRRIDDIEIIRSTRTRKGGADKNTETWLSSEKVWSIQIGDSALAWAKAFGKLISGKYPATKLILDLSQIRPAGERLRGYGWISSGDAQLCKALEGVCQIMNRAAGRLLSVLDILDIVNWMGSILSSRRSAELALLSADNVHWREFATAKKDHFNSNIQRGQSNNSLIFYDKPSKSQLFEVFDLILEGGGTEPGIVNGQQALVRAPYFSGMNPSLRSGTPVMTDHGIMRIEALAGQEFKIRNLHGEWKKASCWLSGRNVPLWRIELEGNHIIYATKEHKWPVLMGAEKKVVKTMTKDLCAGQILPNLKIKDLEIGHEGTYDEGFICGWLFGDTPIVDFKSGNINITVRNEVKDVLGVLSQLLQNVGITPQFEYIEVTDSFQFVCSDQLLFSMLIKYDCISLSGSCIPTSLLHTASEDFRHGFIEALFSSKARVLPDSLYNNHNLVLFSRMSGLASGLADLLGFYGIKSTVETGYDHVPDQLIIHARYGLVDFASVFTLHPSKLADSIASAIFNVQGGVQDTNTIFVKSVIKTDLYEDVWDISVEDETHCFQLAHCITGNCGEILLGDKGFCVHGDTWLITREALVKISDVVGEEVEVWNGQQWAVVVPQITGYHQQMLRIELSDGSYLDCTPYHRLSVTTRFSDHYHEVMAKTVMEHPGKYAIHSEPFKMVNDSGAYVELAYELGFGYGDGYEEKDDVVILLYGRKVGLSLRGVQYQGQYRQNPDVPQRKVVLKDTKLPTIDEVFLWDRTSCLAFIAGLADSDGSNTESGGIRIYQSDEVFIRKLQLLLSKNGIRSSVCLMADVGQSSNFKRTKASWYVSITDVSELPCQRLNTKLGHVPIGKGKYQNIKCIYPLEGEYTSYCFEEPIQHKAVFNNMLTYQCNLVEVVLPRFNGQFDRLKRAIYVLARANYRQSCVNLDDGILQRTWHELNEYLHLCGVGMTGIVQWEFANSPEAFEVLKACATAGANDMADDLDLQRTASVTTVKPSGTLSKVADCTEGVHRPLGKYLFNRINFSIHDPLVTLLQNAGYETRVNPYDSTGMLVTFPVQYDGIDFSEVNGKLVNMESAIAQLERYKMLMQHYVTHNVSSTVSYSPGEIGQIVDWIHANWDSYVSATFMLRKDPLASSDNSEYPYLPQEVVSQAVYDEYTSHLQLVDLDRIDGDFEIDSQECDGGVCPVR